MRIVYNTHVIIKQKSFALPNMFSYYYFFFNRIHFFKDGGEIKPIVFHCLLNGSIRVREYMTQQEAEIL